jgi:DNA-binding CsgD family transcriptional regulator
MARRRSRAAADQAAQQLAKNLAHVVVNAMVAAAARTASSAGEPGTAVAVREKTAPATSSGESVENRMGVRSGLRSAAHRNRKALYPWGLAAGLCAGGHLAWLIGWGNDATGPVTAVVAAAAVIAVVVAAVRPRRRRCRLPADWAPWAALAALNGLAWLILTVAYGPSYGRLVWLAVATAVFGLRWWAHVRRPYPTSGRDPREPLDRPAPAVVVEPAITRSELVDRWNKYLSRPGSPLAGSTVDDDVRAIEHGLVATIRLVPGKQSLQTVRQALPLISTALDSYPEDTIIERHPSGPPSMLQLTVVTTPAVTAPVLFDRPVYDNGKLLLGPYRDGVGNAQISLYSPNSMETGFVLGSRGSGKSRLLEKFALSAMAQGNTVVVYLDGQNGASSPLLWEYALWSGGPAEVPYIMQGLSGFMAYRQLYLRYHRLPGLTPSRELPGILVIVDECHRIWDRTTVEWWANASREWRKLLGGIFASTQVATLKEAFGGSDALRSNLCAGNGIALRTMSDVQQQVFPGLNAKLSELPKGGGHGYTVDEGDTGKARTAPFRDQWLIGQSDINEGIITPPPGIQTAEAWFAEVSGYQQLDPRTAAAGGDAFTGRLARADHDRAELEKMFTGGVLVDFAPPPSMATPAPQANTAGGADAQVIQFPRFTAPTATATLERPATPAAAVDQGPRKPEQLTAAQARVWDVIAAGKGRPAEIAAILNISTAAVHKHLTQMLTDGHIRRAEHGNYEPTS